MIKFRTATVTLEGGVLRSTFGDGVVNDYYVDWAKDDQAYKDIARWAGYGPEYVEFGIAHDLAHHVVADALGWRWSWTLHDQPAQPWPEHIRWEEHLAIALQRKMMLDVEDSHGVLEMVFGERLPSVVQTLREKVALI